MRAWLALSGTSRRSAAACRAALLFLLLIASVLQPTETGARNQLGRQSNTWAARSSTGQTFAGTWTATEDVKTGAVTGTWTLVDAQRRIIASGGWSAAKSPSGWTGSWRAVAVGRSGEYAGTWTATVTLKADARLADLFASAVNAAISGTWDAGRQSGAWSIQAFTSSG